MSEWRHASHASVDLDDERQTREIMADIHINDDTDEEEREVGNSGGREKDHTVVGQNTNTHGASADAHDLQTSTDGGLTSNSVCGDQGASEQAEDSGGEGHIDQGNDEGGDEENSEGNTFTRQRMTTRPCCPDVKCTNKVSICTCVSECVSGACMWIYMCAYTPCTFVLRLHAHGLK